VHDCPRTISLAANVQTGQLIEQRWSKDEEDHYRKHKPTPHRASLKGLCKKTADRARIGSSQRIGSVVRRIPVLDGPSYSNFISTLSECSHIGHSKVRRSSRGASVSMRASIIWVPHFGHCGHTVRVVGWGGGAYTGNPLISATPSKISHRNRKEAVQYCSRCGPTRRLPTAQREQQWTACLSNAAHHPGAAAERERIPG
jgi:hypothetical protein